MSSHFPKRRGHKKDDAQHAPMLEQRYNLRCDLLSLKAFPASGMRGIQ